MVGDLPALTLREKILLWLAHAEDRATEDGPGLSSTQAGIATATRMSRANVSRTVSPLLETGLVTLSEARVPGFPRLLKAYGLTPAGRREAGAIASTVGGATVPVRRAGLDAGTLRLDEALSRATPRLSFWDAVVALEEHQHVDLEATPAASPAPRLLLDAADAPAPVTVFVREREADDLCAWLASNRPRVLLVTAPAGFGKSTLVAHALRQWRPRAHVIWVRIADWFGAEDVLAPLKRALAALGRPVRGATHETAHAIAALRTSARGFPILLVADDAHKAGPAARGALTILGEVVRLEPTVRLLLVARDLALPEGLVREASAIRLAPLADADAERLLAAAGVPPHGRAPLVAAAAGNPLFLQLLGRGVSPTSAPSTDFARYLTGVLTASLPEAERVSLRVLAACRTHARPEIIERAGGGPPAALRRLAASALVLARQDDEYDMHDVVREAFYSEVSLDERRALHARLAQAYRPREGEVAGMEEHLHHLVRAGRRDEAVGWVLAHQHLLLERARQVLAGPPARG